MSRCGTLVICVQNLDFSGANQVVLNIVLGKIHHSNIVVVSPKHGTFGGRFVENSVSVRVGNIYDVVHEIHDIFCIICNTIMTADVVVAMEKIQRIPVIWILHEWWTPSMIVENLSMRNMQGLTLDTIKKAMEVASMIVFVCESQKVLYSPPAKSSVIFVGVPDPMIRIKTNRSSDLDLVASSLQDSDGDLTQLSKCSMANDKVFTFLCLGIVCPRKNQLWTIELFKQFTRALLNSDSKMKNKVKLQIVGARETRLYEIEYLEQVKKLIDNDPNIELINVTSNVDEYFKNADCLILTSLNEVTPMVISEAFSWSIPVLSTNIAGIKEMYTDGIEGFLFEPNDTKKALHSMELIYKDHHLRENMCKAARKRYETFFDINIMVDSYRALLLKVAPPVILVDMDGTIADWDQQFYLQWNNRTLIDRSFSYYMDLCVPSEHAHEAKQLWYKEQFFESIPPINYAIEALNEMVQEGLNVYICTSPLYDSKYCMNEKIRWIVKHLGPSWCDRVIMTQNKHLVQGDLLVDDKPYELLMNVNGRKATSSWKHIIFDAPYNSNSNDKNIELISSRLFHWKDWKKVIYTALGCRSLVSNNHNNDVTVSSLEDTNVKISHNKKSVKVDTSTNTTYPPPPPTTTTSPTSMNKKFSSFSTVSTATNIATVANIIQDKYNMLQLSNEPLSPEDIASIVSGSVSLLTDDEDNCELLTTELLLDTAACNSSMGNTLNVAEDNNVNGNSETGNENSNKQNNTTNNNRNPSYADDIVTTPIGSYDKSSIEALLCKRQALKEKRQEINRQHIENIKNHEWKLQLESDEFDIDGLQLFRNSYQKWRAQAMKLKKS